VIPNGLDDDVLVPPNREGVAAFLTQQQDRTVLSKVAR
jgi:hypothetical protein